MPLDFGEAPRGNVLQQNVPHIAEALVYALQTAETLDPDELHGIEIDSSKLVHDLHGSYRHQLLVLANVLGATVRACEAEAGRQLRKRGQTGKQACASPLTLHPLARCRWRPAPR